MKLKSKSTIYLLISSKLSYSQEIRREDRGFSQDLWNFTNKLPAAIDFETRKWIGEVFFPTSSRYQLIFHQDSSTPEINEQKHRTSEWYAFPNRSIRRDGREEAREQNREREGGRKERRKMEIKSGPGELSRRRGGERITRALFHGTRRAPHLPTPLQARKQRVREAARGGQTKPRLILNSALITAGSVFR